MPASRYILRPDDPVDFHMHTRASDGGWTPERLVDHLAEHGFRAAAVCDHDTMRSVPEVMEHAANRGLLIVPGIEVTTRWGGRQWHLLVYGVDPTVPRGHGFGALVGRQEDELAAAAERGIAVYEQHGHRLPSLGEVVDGRPLLPVHVLLTAIKDGHASNLQTAHELMKGYGEAMTVDVPLEDTVRLAHEAGGTCVVAHPGRDDGAGIMSAEQLGAMLAQVPIDGLECHYRSYTEDDTERYRTMAIEHRLLISAGSDSHAPAFPVNPRPHPARWVVPFLERLGVAVDDFDGESWGRGADAILQQPAADRAAG